VLAIGDIIGRPGREAIAKLVPQLRRELSIDLVVANGENAAGGFGLTPKIADDLFGLGIDVLTSGNHIWDQREMLTGFDHRPILRPHNYPAGAPGKGWYCHDLGEKGQVLIGNVQGQLFMPPIESAFKAADEILRQGGGTRVVLMDIHAEATSEKIAMGWHLDGRASFVFGTDRQASLQRFLTGVPYRFKVADGPVQFNSVLARIDALSGKAASIERVDREIAAL